MLIPPLQFHFGTNFTITFYRICGCLLVICFVYNFFNPVSQVVTTKFDKSYLNFAFRKKHITSVMSAKSRLGNHIFELAATLGISKSIGRTPVFYIQNLSYMKMLKETNETIPGLIDQFTIRYEEFPRNNRITTFNTRCCIYQDPDILKNIDDDLIILNGHYYQSPKYFPEMREILRSYLKTPENEFRNLPKSTESNFINCVHVRRGDFARYDFHVSEPEFIKKALTYIEKQVAVHGKHVNTVLFGDDLQFMRQLIGNATELLMKTKQEIFTFISQNSPTADLLYAAHHCDSVFITAAHSTFGWWMGYFSKGDKVYYTDIRATNDSRYLQGEINPVDYYLPHWTPLKFDNLVGMNIVESKY